MKKDNLIFIGECIIIILLLLILGILLKDNNRNAMSDGVVLEENASNEEKNEAFETAESILDETGDSGVVNVSEFVSDSPGRVTHVSANTIELPKSMEGKKIVVFGDSIWNAARGKDGISEYIQKETGATVYNCAIGGTTAALVDGDNSLENWSSNCFNGMIYVARKIVPAEQVLEGDVVCDIIKQVDFNEMDYVIVAYGLNDFFSDVSIYPEEYYELTNYVGALRNGINKLKENYPHLQIIMVSPTYTKLFEGENTFEIGDYVEAARGVAQEMNVHFLDMFHVLGNSPESRTKHLGDGVHMSAEGRKVYAAAVIHFLEELEAKAEAEALNEATPVSEEVIGN